MKGHFKPISKGAWVYHEPESATLRSRELEYETAGFDGRDYVIRPRKDALFEKRDGRLLLLNTASNFSAYDKILRWAHA